MFYSAVIAALLYGLAACSLLTAQAQGNGTQPPRVYQSGWAGYILYTPNYVPAVVPQNRFQDIEGDWVVPAALPTINCDFNPEQTDGSSLWIGLDGWGQTIDVYPWSDVLQAGTETDVPCWNGQGPPSSSGSTAYFWIEWDGKRNIVTLPVNIGDQVHVRILATTDGPNAWQEATVYLDDLTTQQSQSTTFHSGCLICGKSPVPATLFGNTAEWVVETTFYSANNKKWPNTVNDFGIVQFNNMSVTDNQGITYTPVSLNNAAPEIDWMRIKSIPDTDPRTLLACAAVIGPQEIVISRAPYVIVTPGDQGTLQPKPKTCNGIPTPTQ